MSESKQFFSISELAAGAYRENYVLVIVRESPDFRDTELQGMIAPPSATRVFYTLFTDPGHFDILEPAVTSWEPGNLFYEAPRYLQRALRETHQRHLEDQGVAPYPPYPTPPPSLPGETRRLTGATVKNSAAIVDPWTAGAKSTSALPRGEAIASTLWGPQPQGYAGPAHPDPNNMPGSYFSLFSKVLY